MVRKEFVITEFQLKLIRKRSSESGLSQNEILRRMIDKGLESEKDEI